MDYFALGKNINRYRKRADLTQAQLAEKTGYSDSYIGQVENARTKPSLEAIVKIASALSVTVDQLLVKDIVYPERIYLKEITERLEKYSVPHRIVLCDMITSFLDTFDKLDK